MTIALDTLKPHLTRDFVLAFRALGKQVGYRRLGRAIAYMKLPETRLAAKPKVSRNGRKGKHEWFCRGNGRKHTCVCYSVCRECLVDPKHRFTHDPHHPFTYARYSPNGYRYAKQSPIEAKRQIAEVLPQRVCCGEPMGVMSDALDDHHWRYQCAVDPKHWQDTEVRIGF